MGSPRDALNIDLSCCKFISGQAEGNFLPLCASQILWSINRLSVFTVNEAKLERGAFPGKPFYVSVKLTCSCFQTAAFTNNA